jgi:hypothetical protein
VKILIASLHHFTTVKDSENPCCQPTPFLQQWRTVKTLAASLHHFYDIENPSCQPTTFLQHWRTVKTLAASLHHFTRFIAHFIPLPPAYTILQQWRTLNPCCQPTPFYTVYCPIIYLDLNVRLKRYTVFSLFRNCGFFCVFHTVFFPPRQERTRIMYTRVYRNQRIKRRFVTVKSVFIGRYTASLYRISTATKL